jgi:hypothetical protein
MTDKELEREVSETIGIVDKDDLVRTPDGSKKLALLMDKQLILRYSKTEVRIKGGLDVIEDNIKSELEKNGFANSEQFLNELERSFYVDERGYRAIESSIRNQISRDEHDPARDLQKKILEKGHLTHALLKGLEIFQENLDRAKRLLNSSGDVHWELTWADFRQKVEDRAQATFAKGGIDFNSANLNLQIKRDGRGVPLPLLQQDWAQLSQIQGFIPTILEIRPVTHLPILSELREKLRETSTS